MTTTRIKGIAYITASGIEAYAGETTLMHTFATPVDLDDEDAWVAIKGQLPAGWEIGSGPATAETDNYGDPLLVVEITYPAALG